MSQVRITILPDRLSDFITRNGIIEKRAIVNRPFHHLFPEIKCFYDRAVPFNITVLEVIK
jgi:hypothetical protein